MDAAFLRGAIGGGDLLPDDPRDRAYVPREREDPGADDADFDAYVDDWTEVRDLAAARRARVEAQLAEAKRRVADLERRLARLN